MVLCRQHCILLLVHFQFLEVDLDKLFLLIQGTIKLFNLFVFIDNQLHGIFMIFPSFPKVGPIDISILLGLHRVDLIADFLLQPMQIEVYLFVILLSEDFVGFFGVGLQCYQPILELLYLIKVFLSQFGRHFVYLVEYSSEVFDTIGDLLHYSLDQHYPLI